MSETNAQDFRKRCEEHIWDMLEKQEYRRWLTFYRKNKIDGTWVIQMKFEDGSNFTAKLIIEHE